MADNILYWLWLQECLGAYNNVRYLLEKYGDREDVTKEELYLCIEGVEALIKAGKLYSEDTFDGIQDLYLC